jgi:hypothetical protein
MEWERIILLALGIVVLCSFFPFSVVSFRKYRLPKKQIAYERIRRILGKDRDTDEEETLQVLFREEYKGRDYILPVCFVTLFCALGFWVLFSDRPPIILTGIYAGGFNHMSTGALPYTHLSLVAIGMAILGSYVWSILYIARRLINLDLSPGAYYSIGTRIVLATFVSLTFHHFTHSMPAEVKNEMIELLPVIAFLTGIFPQRAMQYIQDKLVIFKRLGKGANELSLDMIEGMNLFNKVRLSEVGIDNAQNMAEANLEELIRKTPFNPRLLLDWIAQAKLYVVVKDQITSLRKAGVRTVLDLCVACDENGLTDLAKLSEISQEQLATMYQVINEDPDVAAMSTARKNLSES